MKDEDKFQRCEGSGITQVVDWMPDDEGYPGAAVCLYCSYGVMLRKRSVKDGESGSGFKTKVGTLRVHFVKWGDSPTGGREPVRLSYWPQGRKGKSRDKKTGEEES